MSRLEKGQRSKLNVTQKARHRVMAGLGWDPAGNPGFIDKVKALAGQRDVHHDLDLACYIFGPDKEFIQMVSAEPGHAIDSTEAIYHSGDNEEGYGEGDDEEISAELKDLPEAIHHLVFVALVRTTHNFSDISAAEIRLADGYTNHDFLQTLLNHKEGSDKNVFVFAEISRTPESPSNWQLHNISEYINYTGTDDFPNRVKKFL